MNAHILLQVYFIGFVNTLVARICTIYKNIALSNALSETNKWGIQKNIQLQMGATTVSKRNNNNISNVNTNNMKLIAPLEYRFKQNKKENRELITEKSLDLIKNSNFNLIKKIKFPFFYTTIVAKKRLFSNKILQKNIARYKGVGEKHISWFNNASGCLKNTLVNSMFRNSVLEIHRYISIDKNFKTEKKLYFLEKEQKRKWWSIFSYKNTRRKKGLPIRGQRTKTNASTASKLRIKTTKR